jgi:acetolactate synthase-1/2/3 large subunit
MKVPDLVVNCLEAGAVRHVFGLPGGIAARLAHPDRPVAAAMGNGGFLMNAQEIETAVRIGAGFTNIVFNDNDYGLISWKQAKHNGGSYGTRLSNPDFRKYAENSGIKGYAPKTMPELHDNPTGAISSQKRCLVEITIEPPVNQEPSKKPDADICKSFKLQ